MGRFQNLLAAKSIQGSPVAFRNYRCRCGHPIFFRNSECLACGALLGYEANLGCLSSLDPAGETGLWRLSGPDTNFGETYRRCANLTSPSGCNWLAPAMQGSENAPTLCQSCRLERTVPDLSIAANAQAYRRISIAKRRLVALLISLGLPVRSRTGEDPEHGLAFDFLRSPPEGPRVMTGHDHGIITLNIEEAEDSTREQIRAEMQEPYRTLLGHLRHETGHYYWDRLIAGTAWIEEFRGIFGDERQSYAEALQIHYEQGPPANWRERYVSSYASAHPWEDWAETWAHYLHMLDTLECALGFGLDPVASLDVEVQPFTPDALYRDQDPGGPFFLHFLNSWTRLTAVLNELSRAMGFNDFYPFVLSRSAVSKLHFIHLVVETCGVGAQFPDSGRGSVA
jgi:hypothetical protein